CLEKLTKNLLSAAAEGKLSEDDKEKQKTEIEKDMFKVFCYQAESAVAQEQHDVAMRLAQRCKEMLARLPKEARTLRLLASAYLEWDSKQHWQKALNAVGLANSEHSHSAGLHLKVHILLVSDNVEDNRLVSAVTDCLHHPEVTVELALNTIKLLVEHKRTQLALDGVKQLTQQFQASPGLWKVYLLHLRILLDNREMQAAQGLVEDCITGHNTTRPLDTVTRKRFHLLLWEQAAHAYEANDHEEALRWYDYSRDLFSSSDGQDKNMAKLERNRSACFLHLKQYDKALEAARLAETCDPPAPTPNMHSSRLLFYKATVMLAIEKMGTADEKGEEDSTVEGLVCLAAQLAFEGHMKGKAHSKLQELKGTKEDGVVNEATWFMKIAWNLGLKCGEDSNMMHQFFNMCFKFSSLCPVDMANLVRKKTCALMAAAACLQSARNASDPDEKKKMLKKVILYVDTCRETCREISNNKISDTDCTGDSTPILLCLYEFEAKAKLGEPDLAQLVDRVMAMPQADAKTLETLAALAQEAPAAQPTISVKALKEAIKRHLQTSNTDFTKCSKAFHSLIQLVLNKGSNSDPSSKEEAWGYYKEAMDIIDNKSQMTTVYGEVLAKIEAQKVRSNKEDNGTQQEVDGYKRAVHKSGLEELTLGRLSVRQLSTMRVLYLLVLLVPTCVLAQSFLQRAISDLAQGGRKVCPYCPYCAYASRCGGRCTRPECAACGYRFHCSSTVHFHRAFHQSKPVDSASEFFPRPVCVTLVPSRPVGFPVVASRPDRRITDASRRRLGLRRAGRVLRRAGLLLPWSLRLPRRSLRRPPGASLLPAPRGAPMSREGRRLSERRAVLPERVPRGRRKLHGPSNKNKRCCLPDPTNPAPTTQMPSTTKPASTPPATTTPKATPPPPSKCSKLKMVSRGGWGARPPKKRTLFANPPSRVVIHHSDGYLRHLFTWSYSSVADYRERVQDIQEGHFDRGFDDIGYNFLIDGFGNVYEGRGWDYSGAHVPCCNSFALGINFLGYFDSRTPTPAAREAGENLIACGVEMGKIRQGYDLKCHLDLGAASGDTDCPGAALCRYARRHYSGL
ncbi:Testis-expressed protein 11, partial [Branchiostoma belcheri]